MWTLETGLVSLDLKHTQTKGMKNQRKKWKISLNIQNTNLSHDSQCVTIVKFAQSWAQLTREDEAINANA